MRRQRNDRGLALVLVLTVILALAIIATPFVLSMLKQEQSATTHKAGTKADYGSEIGTNWAAYLAMQGIDKRERELGLTPYCDSMQEFQVPPRDGRLALDANTTTGTLIGMAMQDEQSKLNIRSCPERAITTLKGLVDTRITDPRDYLTTYSVRDAHWIFPQRVRMVGQITIPGAGQISNGVQVDNAAHYGVGSLLRFTRAGTTVMETKVTVNYLFSSGVNVVETQDVVGTGFINGVVEVEARHAVNVCTARKEVMIAMWTGLTITLAGASDAVTPDGARALADTTYAKQYDNFVDWALAVVSVGSLSQLCQTAIIINALDPTNAVLNGSGTVGVCFISHDVVTVEGRAVTNSPAGSPISKARFREVIEVSPPAAIAVQLISQYDFDLRMNASVIAAGPLTAYFNGFPWGSRMLTAPNMPPNPSDKTFSSQMAWVQLADVNMLRGYSQYTPLLHPTEHFPTELEGHPLGGGVIQYPWNQVLTTVLNPPDPNPLNNRPDATAGGIEFWVRLDAIVSPTTIIDIRESDFSNRLSLRYESGQLIMTVSDFTVGDSTIPLDKGLAELKRPFTPMTDTWYHIGAYWKGTRYGHMALLIDGFSDPLERWNLADEDGRIQSTELMSDLAQAATGMSLKDPTWVPDPTVPDPGPVPLLIGNEVVHYDKTTGTILRGMRNTAAQFHQRGTKVTLYGYSARLQPLQVSIDLVPFGLTGTLVMAFDRLPLVNGRVNYDFGQNPNCTVMGDKGSMPTYIDAAQNFVPVNGTITDFPQKGYILIDQEVIYYDQIDTTVVPNQFKMCVRAQHGTIAAQHNTPRPVRLWCVPTTNTNNYLSPTIIQIGNEWIGPVVRDPLRPTFFIGYVSGTAPLPLMRGVLSTGASAHSTVEDIIPLFAARETDMAVNRHNLFMNDRITLTDASNNKEMHRIRWRSLANGPFAFNMAETQLAGLASQVLRDYIPDQLHVRVGKWPSGELVGLNWLTVANPQFTIGPAAATVDEVKFYGSPKGNFFGTVQVNDVGGALSMNGAGGLSQTGGAVKIGDEIVGYVNITGNNLNKCKRGWLNSPPQVHDVGDLAFNMSFLPIAALTTDLAAGDTTVSISQPLIGEPGYSSGYVYIDQEVLGFEWTAAGGRQLIMPPDMNSTGLWRGCFGSTRNSHLTDALVYGIPFRYRDSYRPGAWDNLMPYFQASWTLRGARWRTILWQDEVSQNDQNVVVHCILRADGMGNLFDLPGATDTSLIWDFARGGTPYPITYRAQLRDAGQLDARFEVEYLAGSYWPNHSWKRTPKIKQVDVEYDRDTKVLFHEEK